MAFRATDDEEALAVSIALRTATAGAVGGIEEPALRALVKLEQAMPLRLREQVDALRSTILPLDRTGPVVEASLLATLASACRDQLRLIFSYEDGKGRATQRSVEPQGVVHTGMRWYLVAWDCEQLVVAIASTYSHEGNVATEYQGPVVAMAARAAETNARMANERAELLAIEAEKNRIFADVAKLAELPAAVFELTGLVELRVSDNPLSMLP